MGFFSRLTGSDNTAGRRADTLRHFSEFVSTRKGVEAYFEVESAREPSALVLVARDGEWTRRPVPNAKAGAKLATDLGIPFYEVLRTGYPQRMRQWSAKNKRS